MKIVTKSIRYSCVKYYAFCLQIDADSSSDDVPYRVGSVGSVSASRTVGREFASRPSHTKDHHKNGTNCLPA